MRVNNGYKEIDYKYHERSTNTEDYIKSMRIVSNGKIIPVLKRYRTISCNQILLIIIILRLRTSAKILYQLNLPIHRESFQRLYGIVSYNFNDIIRRTLQNLAKSVDRFYRDVFNMSQVTH